MCFIYFLTYLSFACLYLWFLDLKHTFKSAILRSFHNASFYIQILENLNVDEERLRIFMAMIMRQPAMAGSGLGKERCGGKEGKEEEVSGPKGTLLVLSESCRVVGQPRLHQHLSTCGCGCVFCLCVQSWLFHAVKHWLSTERPSLHAWSDLWERVVFRFHLE